MGVLKMRSHLPTQSMKALISSISTWASGRGRQDAFRRLDRTPCRTKVPP